MSEFKGTEGKWLFKYVNGFIKIISEENGVNVLDTYNNQKDKSNALLISKAPEMLEMLKELTNQIENEHVSDWLLELQDNAKELIKEATEL